MTQHLFEAIVINGKRSQLYSELSEGKSRFISGFLIFSEILTLPLSLFLDLIAKYWQWKGVPVLVHEFIPMEKTPSFQKSYPIQFSPSDALPTLEFNKDYKNLQIAFKTFEYKKMSLAFEQALKSLESFPQYYCMLRHLLESGLRCSNLADRHVGVAHEKNVLTPHWFCLYLVFTHIFPLKLGLYLDKKAYEVQKLGIPIIYQDVPPIPAFPENY